MSRRKKTPSDALVIEHYLGGLARDIIRGYNADGNFMVVFNPSARDRKFRDREVLTRVQDIRPVTLIEGQVLCGAARNCEIIERLGNALCGVFGDKEGRFTHIHVDATKGLFHYFVRGEPGEIIEIIKQNDFPGYMAAEVSACRDQVSSGRG